MNGLFLVLSLLATSKHPAPEDLSPNEQFVSIHPGNTAHELLQAYGKPSAVVNDTSLVTGKRYQQYIYHMGPCAGVSCSVIVIDGKVSEVSGAKPDLMM